MSIFLSKPLNICAIYVICICQGMNGSKGHIYQDTKEYAICFFDLFPALRLREKKNLR